MLDLSYHHFYVNGVPRWRGELARPIAVEPQLTLCFSRYWMWATTYPRQELAWLIKYDWKDYYSRYRPGLGSVVVFLSILSLFVQYAVQHLMRISEVQRIKR